VVSDPYIGDRTADSTLDGRVHEYFILKLLLLGQRFFVQTKGVKRESIVVVKHLVGGCVEGTCLSAIC
jgi:hypothetical protein